MSIKEVPILIPNFNQLSYLRNLINQIRFYYPENRIYIVDNGSDYRPLKEYYMGDEFYEFGHPSVKKYTDNNFINNLTDFITKNQFEYYVISDPDLSIPPPTPPNFLEIFKTAIDVYGFHHAGFGLITDDIPGWNPKAGWIQGDEKDLLKKPEVIEHEGKSYGGWRAPIDTTFCLYKRDNGGWSAPMPPQAWDNSLRIFGVHHLMWYLDKNHLNEEMKNYFATCKTRDNTLPSAGRNHYQPQ